MSRQNLSVQRLPRAVGRGIKLAVVTPALNEEETVANVVQAVPRRLGGVDSVEVIVVDDGSTDATAVRARAAGADRIVAHATSRGLVASFTHGVSEAIAAGADVVVHLDSDGQHDPADIPRLLAPILQGNADIVVGARPLAEANEMTRTRRLGNRLGSWVFRHLLRLPLTDFTSGYRALSREALMRLNLVSDYTYTVESLVQAARLRLAVAEVQVRPLARRVGESRMTQSPLRYMWRTGGQALRCLLHGSPLDAFGRAAAFMLVATLSSTAWFLWGYQSGGMHLPSLLAAVLGGVFTVGLFVAGLIADAVNSNRRLLEDALYRLKSLEVAAAGSREGDDTRRERAPLTA